MLMGADLFEFDWQSEQRWEGEKAAEPESPSRLSRGRVRRTMLLHWQEHCLECAPPQCYQTCLLFVARADHNCARLVYGFARNRRFSGLFDCGSDVRFRRWGKIETRLRPRGIPTSCHRVLAAADQIVTGMLNLISSVLRSPSSFRRLSGALTACRRGLLDAFGTRGASVDADYDEFVLECFSPDTEPVRLLLELWNDANMSFRQALPIQPGHNFVSLPAERILGVADWPAARLALYPENDAEARLIFTWLDFVKYQPSSPQLGGLPTTPASKVKCVAWDLDNTLWLGVLAENGPEGLALREEAVDLVRLLDRRGILQTVVSKNDCEPAMAVLRRHGLAEFFLRPAINWGAKSANLERIATGLNLGLDAFALIDDSPFEREEVRSVFPMVRVFAETQIGALAQMPEFDVPITEMSLARRKSYLTEAEREAAQQTFVGDYLSFLRTCGMRLRVFSAGGTAAGRCHELVQRSNQLNLSSRRYTVEEFSELLRTSGMLNIALHASDRFGDHGIVGFVTVDERGGELRVTNFVLSCRVAKKQIEHAFFHWLAQRARRRGDVTLVTDLVITDRNGPLVAVFDELGFRRVKPESGGVRLQLELAALPADNQVVAVTEDLSE